MNELTVTRTEENGGFSYRIVWEENFDALAGDLADIPDLRAGKVCIVSDSNVAPLYLEQVRSALSGSYSTVDAYVFPAGEESKNLDTAAELYRFLIEHKYERRDILAALGGGVTGDLTGFVSATYLRGVDFIQIPTTLLSQVDSSVGGKTGVDFAQYKNMVGAFHQPRLVYMNLAVLETLPEDQFASGMGEVLKTGLIRSRELFDWIDENRDRVLARDRSAMAHVIRECCRIKADVVAEDPLDKGIRGILNFGHTLGHAVEKCKNFELLHGQCVGIGSAAASWLSMKRGLITAEDYAKILELHRYFGIPVSTSGLLIEEVIAAARSDKKMEAGRIKFILLDGIGNALIDHSVTEEEMADACGTILEQ